TCSVTGGSPPPVGDDAHNGRGCGRADDRHGADAPPRVEPSRELADRVGELLAGHFDVPFDVCLLSCASHRASSLIGVTTSSGAVAVAERTRAEPSRISSAASTSATAATISDAAHAGIAVARPSTAAAVSVPTAIRPNT